jgi:hypothetical protein
MPKTVRHFTTDAPTKRVRDAAGPARRTLICTYPGTGFSAERDDSGALNVYLLSEDAVPTLAIGDRKGGWMTPTRLQRVIEDHRKAEASK